MSPPRQKPFREARAEAFVTMLPGICSMIIDGSHHKGDVFCYRPYRRI
ncbi:hypothetical protein ACNKHO_04820 [Shigella flexneri]